MNTRTPRTLTKKAPYEALFLFAGGTAGQTGQHARTDDVVDSEADQAPFDVFVHFFLRFLNWPFALRGGVRFLVINSPWLIKFRFASASW